MKKSYLQNIDNIGISLQNDSLKYSTVAAVHQPRYFKAAYCRRCRRFAAGRYAQKYAKLPFFSHIYHFSTKEHLLLWTKENNLK